jgi:DNA-binding MarR family transcriptional regulator
MSKSPTLKKSDVPYEITRMVRDTCVCLHVQRAARSLARQFDEAFRDLDLSHGQFSLMMSLNRPEPPTISAVAALLAMDRTTLTAALKPLERRRLVKISVDPRDRRGRRLALTPAGEKLLSRAVPIWKRTHAAIEKSLDAGGPAQLRTKLNALL